MSAKLQTVHVRVNDAATGQPTPCRVRFTDSCGNYYAPFGRLVNFPRGWNEDVGGNLYIERKSFDGTGNFRIDARKYALIDGTCEIALPSGRLHVEAHKGLEFKPISQDIDLSTGKLAVRVSLERWADLRTQGWYSADCRCHFLTPNAALLEGAAEDVGVVNLLAKEVDLLANDFDSRSKRRHRRQFPAVPNLLAFSGQRPSLEMMGHMVVVNTYNYHGRVGEAHGDFGVLGDLSLLNCHRVVFPLRFGGREEGVENWTLADWCDQCHRKGGLVIWRNKYWHSEVPDSYCGEALAEVILGKVDAWEFSPDTQSGHFDDWYKLLACGFLLPAVGASGKEWNNCPIGIVRTYARIQRAGQLDYKNWIEAVRAGRTFVTMGPLLSFTVNGEDPGAVIRSVGPCTLQVRAEAKSLEPFESLALILNGEIIKLSRPTGEFHTATIEEEVRLETNSWLASCCFGEPPYAMAYGHYLAHSSPIYVRFEGQPFIADRNAADCLLPHLDRMLEWVRQEARCETEQNRERLANIFRSAREELLKRVAS